MAFPYIAVMVGLALINAGIQYYQHRKSNQAQENDTPGLDDGALPRVTESDPIPVVWGTVRLRGVNVVWWGALDPDIGEKLTGATGKVTAGELFAHQVFCQGPIDEVLEIKIEDRLAEIDPDEGETYPLELDSEPTFLEGVVGEWSVVSGQGSSVTTPNRATSWLYNVYLMGGYPTQDPPATMKDQFGLSTPGFRGVFGIWSAIRWNTESNRILPISATVRRRHVRSFGDDQWLPLKAAIGEHDMNPAHIIREILTDEQWGAFLGEDRIDEASFEAAANTLYDESFGLSGSWGRQEKYRDKLADVLRHIDGIIYEERTTGKFVLRLVRRDYDIEDLDVLGPSQVTTVSKTRPTSFELVNDVTVKYSSRDVDRMRTVPARDTAAQSIRGIVSETISYPMIYDGDLAAKVATRDLVAMSSPVANVQIGVIPSVGKSMRPGDVFVLTYPSKGINQMVVRVTSQEQPGGNSRASTIKVQGVEDVFAFIDAISTPPGEIIPPLPFPPPLPAEQVGFELPLWMSYRALQEVNPIFTLSAVAASDMGQTGLVAWTDQGGAIDWTMWSDDASRDVGVEFAQKVDITLSASGYNIEEDPGATFSFDDEDSIDDSRWVLFYLPADEMVAITGSAKPIIAAGFSGTGYLSLGIFDTVPPLSIPSSVSGYVIGYMGDPFVATFPTTPSIDRLYGVDIRMHEDGETKSLSALPRTSVSTLPPSSAPQTDITIDQRILRPYPPGRIRVDGALDGGGGSIEVTWRERDRVGSQRQQSSNNSSSPAGVDVVIKIYADDAGTWTLIRTETVPMSDESYTYSNVDEELDRRNAGAPEIFGDLAIAVSSIEDGLTSFAENTRYYERT